MDPQHIPNDSQSKLVDLKSPLVDDDPTSKSLEISSRDDTKDHASTPRPVRRFASIDFMRGLAIVFMLLLHILMDTLDVGYYTENITSVAAINFLALVSLPFLGGLAGLFLLTSAAGNAVSSRKNLERGHSSFSIAIKQVFGGFIIVFSAMFCEAFICIHGALGSIMKNLDKIGLILKGEVLITSWRFQGYVFETLHAIGWCTVVNGLIQSLLFCCCGKNFDRTVKICWFLIVLVLLATPFIWSLISLLIPGYPFENNPETGLSYFLPYTGISPWYDFFLYFFVNPLAAPVEPIFPYLGTALLGSIIGYKMVEASVPSETVVDIPPNKEQESAETNAGPTIVFDMEGMEPSPREEEIVDEESEIWRSGEYVVINYNKEKVEREKNRGRPSLEKVPSEGFVPPVIDESIKNVEEGQSTYSLHEELSGRENKSSFVAWYLLISIVMFFVGLVGLIYGFFLSSFLKQGSDATVAMYLQLYNHRLFVQENGAPLGWLFQYLALNGFSLMLTMVTVRIVECRGETAARAFATNPIIVFVRRFGFVAFTMYVLQWFYPALHYAVTSAYPDVEPYGGLPWLGSFAIVVLHFLAMYIVMRIWENLGYIGSMEAIMGTLASFLIPLRKQSDEGAENLRWWQRGQLNVEGAFYGAAWMGFVIDENSRVENETRLVRILSVLGIFLFPFSFISYGLVRGLEKEGVNLSCWKVLNIVSMLFDVVLIVSLCIVSPSLLGVQYK